MFENVKNGIIKRNLTANGKLACLNFWYQSYGYTSNTLKIFVLVNGRKLLLWNSTLGTTTSWEKGNTTIYLNYNRFSVSHTYIVEVFINLINSASKVTNLLHVILLNRFTDNF